MQNLALSYKRQSRFKESEYLLLKIRLLRSKTMGGAHAEVSCTTLHLAALYHQMGRLDLASSLFELSLPLMEQHEAVCPAGTFLLSALRVQASSRPRLGRCGDGTAQLCIAEEKSETV